MDGGAGKSGVSHGFHAGVSGMANEHEIFEAILFAQYLYYLRYHNQSLSCTDSIG